MGETFTDVFALQCKVVQNEEMAEKDIRCSIQRPDKDRTMGENSPDVSGLDKVVVPEESIDGPSVFMEKKEGIMNQVTTNINIERPARCEVTEEQSGHQSNTVLRCETEK